jgi:hypothetical protein
MRSRSWIIGTVFGLLAGFLVAIPMTVLDWHLNPSGVFHDETGTHWTVVAETAISWFWPVAVLVLAITVLLLAWLSRARSTSSTK